MIIIIVIIIIITMLYIYIYRERERDCSAPRGGGRPRRSPGGRRRPCSAAGCRAPSYYPATSSFTNINYHYNCRYQKLICYISIRFIKEHRADPHEAAVDQRAVPELCHSDSYPCPCPSHAQASL